MWREFDQAWGVGDRAVLHALPVEGVSMRPMYCTSPPTVSASSTDAHLDNNWENGAKSLAGPPEHSVWMRGLPANAAGPSRTPRSTLMERVPHRRLRQHGRWRTGLNPRERPVLRPQDRKETAHETKSGKRRPEHSGSDRRFRRSTAVAVGFEPTVEFPPHTLSRRAPLAARTRHRRVGYRSRRAAKKSSSRRAHSGSRTPPTTATRWLARGSRATSHTEPQAPALGS